MKRSICLCLPEARIKKMCVNPQQAHSESFKMWRSYEKFVSHTTPFWKVFPVCLNDQCPETKEPAFQTCSPGSPAQPATNPDNVFIKAGPSGALGGRGQAGLYKWVPGYPELHSETLSHTPCNILYSFSHLLLLATAHLSALPPNFPTFLLCLFSLPYSYHSSKGDS